MTNSGQVLSPDLQEPATIMATDVDQTGGRLNQPETMQLEAVHPLLVGFGWPGPEVTQQGIRHDEGLLLISIDHPESNAEPPLEELCPAVLVESKRHG